ncbi:unnamed protein product [Lasius platythorax]|uniref:Transposable element P transposase-like GTP-binding insertion domain-containing protein n=1 Tax=Lasius platythorax TaxID=488582 RepID=A0AAV2P6R5_9HYME
MTCDGTNTNISIMEALGCKLLRLPLEKIQEYFSHPNDKDRVYFTSDACHMLKLARKIMSHCKQLLSEKGIIRWQYIRELYYLQSAIGLKGAGHSLLKNSGAKVEFIKIIDRIFDFLNSRSPYGKESKALLIKTTSST